MQNKFEALLQSEDQHIQKLNQLVIDAVKEQELISDKLYEFEDKNPSLTGKVADKVASFGGSWKFILSFAVVMIVWMAANAYLLTRPFDPFPFILLNLLLSTLAAIQAPVIMMSQNRKEEKDRQRAVNDYLINLKAEIEIRNMHLKLDLLMTDQMRTLFDMQKMQVELMEEIKRLMKEQPTR
jgi:uncharacterized membrane protein